MMRARKPTLHLTSEVVPRYWFAGNPVATHIANGVNLLFPAGERYFMRSVGRYLSRIKDPKLRSDVRAFFGQEGQHAHAHEQDFARLRAQGYSIDRFLAVYQKVAYGILEKIYPAELNLACTAASEHFTAILAQAALTEGTLDDAHPEMRALLLWHAAEEIEHKHVAFDVLKEVNPSYALRIAGLVVATASLASWWVIAAIVLLVQERAPLETLRGAVAASRKRPAVFVRGIREYVRRDFHPRDVDNYELARSYLASVGLESTPQAAA